MENFSKKLEYAVRNEVERRCTPYTPRDVIEDIVEDKLDQIARMLAKMVYEYDEV